MEGVEKCGDVITLKDGSSYTCELAVGHRKKHRGGGHDDVPGGVTWTSAGRDRIAAEIKAEQSKGKSQ